MRCGSDASGNRGAAAGAVATVAELGPGETAAIRTAQASWWQCKRYSVALGVGDLDVRGEIMRRISLMGGAFECGSLKQGARSCEAGERGQVCGRDDFR